MLANAHFMIVGGKHFIYNSHLLKFNRYSVQLSVNVIVAVSLNVQRVAVNTCKSLFSVTIREREGDSVYIMSMRKS